MEARRGVEIVALGDDDALGDLARQREVHQRVPGLLVGGAMIFPHAKQQSARRIHDAVGITQGQRWREGARRVARQEPVQPLIAEVGEIEHSLVDGVRAAAVFVDARARAEGGGQHVAEVAVGGAADDDVTPAFAGTSLDPVQVGAIEAGRFQPYRPGHDQRGGNGRFPGAVGRDCYLCHLALLCRAMGAGLTGHGPMV